MGREAADVVYMQMAVALAQRGTCIRRRVGCVLTAEDNRVLAVGYNGVPKRFPHCTDGKNLLCTGQNAESGVELYGGCIAIHAEANALDQCRERENIRTCYSTASPCVQCALELLNTPCERLVYMSTYESHWERTIELWRHAGRTYECVVPELTLPDPDCL